MNFLLSFDYSERNLQIFDCKPCNQQMELCQFTNNENNDAE